MMAANETPFVILKVYMCISEDWTLGT